MCLKPLDVWLLSLFQHLRPVVLKRLLKCGIVWKALAFNPDELRFIGFFLFSPAKRGVAKDEARDGGALHRAGGFFAAQAPRGPWAQPRISPGAQSRLPHASRSEIYGFSGNIERRLYSAGPGALSEKRDALLALPNFVSD